MAAKYNYFESVHNLGYIFFQEGNLEKAKHYYLLSADQGNKKSMHNLGLMYLKEGNKEKALHYFNLAKK